MDRRPNCTRQRRPNRTTVPQSQILQSATPGIPTADYFYGGDRYGSTRLAVAYSTLPTAHSWYVGDLQGSNRYSQNDAGAPNTAVTYYDPFGQVEGARDDGVR